jgi:hypothetical protein
VATPDPDNDSGNGITYDARDYGHDHFFPSMLPLMSEYACGGGSGSGYNRDLPAFFALAHRALAAADNAARAAALNLRLRLLAGFRVAVFLPRPPPGPVLVRPRLPRCV